MSKYIKFQVSEDRFTHYKAIGFEQIDSIVNKALDNLEKMEQSNHDNKTDTKQRY